MAAEDIDIRVNVTGATESAAGVRGVSTEVGSLTRAVDEAGGQVVDFVDGLSRMSEEGRRARQAQQALVHNIGEMVQPVQAATTMIRQLAEAIGNDAVAGAASLVGGMATGAAQGAALGASLGPVGMGLGAVIGGLTPAIHALSEGVDTVNISFSNLEANARAAHTALAEVRDMAPELETALANIAEMLGSVDDFAPSWGLRTAGEGPRGLEDVARTLGVSNEGRRGGGSRRREEPTDFYAEIDNESANDAAARIDAELTEGEELHAAYVERIQEQEREKQDYLIELAAEEADREKAAIAQRIEDEEAKNEAILELNRERLEREEEEEEQARQRQIEAQTEFMELGMNVVGLMTDALGAIASGEKTAEDAFKGLAKAFLQMISQYAMLKAATEFAEAIGAFASFNYGGGALHLAAGVAFTAVAVATGVGAAAINVAKPTAPARPEADRDSAGSKAGGGDVVINWNSPVVTAGTRDDLGRELGALVSAGRARYGDV